MGLIADLIQFFREEDGDAQVGIARGDLGGEDIVHAPNYQPSAVDSHPVQGDYLVVVPGPEAGTFVAVGYLDPKNAGTTRPGEVSLYLRDENGEVQGELFLASEEPDWKATAGALIARADRVDKRFDDLEAAHNTHVHETTATVGVGPAVGEISPTTDQVSGTPTGADTGWVT